ncbi:hypothetical protein TNCV_2278711 [Trichonephila clavipes]|uniref:Uncharacterized protein n=1 Tax=Trichonephila clavipes TaxID=2585209 RepID=A0A8X6R4S7_TRICX|nr:hypothetical protein TNCV_2278711 [Trichonephila clavipes]
MDPQPRNLAQLATALESAWLNIPENTFRDVTLFLHVLQQSALRKVVILDFDRWGSTTEEPSCSSVRRSRCSLNLPRFKSPPFEGVEVRRGDGAQVSPLSLDHGSKLQGPSPITLAHLYSTMLL